MEPKKKIYFFHLSSTANVIMALGIFGFVLFGLYKMFIADQSNVGLGLISLGTFISAIPSLILFFKKHFISWNKKGMNFKLSGQRAQNISFKGVENFSIDYFQMNFSYRGKPLDYDLSIYSNKDIDLIKKIFVDQI